MTQAGDQGERNASIAASPSAGLSSAVASPSSISGTDTSGQSTSAKVDAHQHSLSLSPRSNPVFSDPEYYADREDVDDVFSNPDSAELEARSDATGSTSPDRATSPYLSSPDSRGRTGYDHALFDSTIDQSFKQSESIAAAAALRHSPSRDSQFTQNTATPVLDDSFRGWGASMVTPTPSHVGRNDPYTRRASLRARPLSAQFNQPLMLHDANMPPLPAANDMPSDPSQASHISTLFAHPIGPPLPPSSAATLQRSPALSAIRLALSTSPTFSPKSGASKSASAAGSPAHEKGGFHWSATTDYWASQSPSSRSTSRGPLAAATAGASESRTNPTTRLTSPDRSQTIIPPLTSATPSPHPRGDLKIAVASFRAKSSESNDGEVRPALSSSPVSSALSSRASAGTSVGLGLSSPQILSSPNPRCSVDISGHGVLREKFSVSEGTVQVPSESSIFERDIEHRDVRHVLSKSEAVDVAIPSVLDDAVEAIIEGGERPLEIVAPLSSASAVPHLLTATALSSSSIPSSTGSYGVGTSSPTVGFASRIPSAVGFVAGSIVADEPPPGSMAAQIAERLGASRSPVGDETSNTTTGAVSFERRSRPMHSQSSAASSVTDSVKSRSPGPPSASVQQILEEGTTSLPGNPLAARGAYTLRDLSPTSHGGSIGYSATASRAMTDVHSRTASLSHQALSSAPTSAPSTGTAVPSLPLPNPFRPESPSVTRPGQCAPSASALGFMDGAGLSAASVTMSVDGAIIPSSESAIRELSLDGMADVLAEVGNDVDPPSLSPIVPRRSVVADVTASTSALPPPASPSITFARRDTSTTITAADMGVASPTIHALSAKDGSEGYTGAGEVDMPGGFPEEIFDSSNRSATPPTATTSPTTRRLSFFSYADIINDTPAELVDFEEVVSREMASNFIDDSRPAPCGGGMRVAATSPRASFGGAGLAKPFPSAPHGDAAVASITEVTADNASTMATGSAVLLGRKCD